MSSYQNQVVYEEYSRQHYNQLLGIAADARRIKKPVLVDEPPSNKGQVRSVWNRKLAYVLAITLLVALTLTQVVIAAINAGGGHGGLYLVR